VSPNEAAEFTAHGARHVEILAHACKPVAREARPSWEEREGLLFVGSFHADGTPNADALNWFVREVMPRLPESMTLRVAGVVTAPSVQRLAGPRVTLLGPVADLYTEYDRARVFVAPGRFGAGIPLKVVEAAAGGLPVVTTPLLAQQLGWTDGLEVSAIANADDFAVAVVRLHGDRGLWERLQADALASVRRDFSLEAFREIVNRILPQH
jgi:glycosyltransferase involved in cell wall biosynthesis